MAIQEACSEVNYILTYLDPQDKKKIPNSVIEFFNENKDLFYKVQIDKDKPLKDQPLLEETKALLHLLHYNYLANEEEKRELKQYIQESDIIADINKNDGPIMSSKENTELTVYNDSFYKKFGNKLKSIFNSLFSIFKKRK